jgi:hypothetical protein
MGRFCSAIFLLLATGCASMEWAKPDATAEQAAADSQTCDEEAWRVLRWYGMGYGPVYGPFYGPFSPWMYRDGWGRPFAGPAFGPFYDPLADRYLEEQRLANFCMRSKGYELVPVPK